MYQYQSLQWRDLQFLNNFISDEGLFFLLPATVISNNWPGSKTSGTESDREEWFEETQSYNKVESWCSIYSVRWLECLQHTFDLTKLGDDKITAAKHKGRCGEVEKGSNNTILQNTFLDSLYTTYLGRTFSNIFFGRVCGNLLVLCLKTDWFSVWTLFEMKACVVTSGN